MALTISSIFFSVSEAQAGGEPSFSKAFASPSIAPNGNSTLIFTIRNNQGVVISDLAFTDSLPAGVTISTPANATTDCLGTVTAPNGGGTITFTDGELAASATCTVEVNVTSNTVGVHTNVSGDLTSSAGNGGTATADLTVASNRPSFSKSFSPSSVGIGGRGTLTFTIDNSASANFASGLVFQDVLPDGLEVADPANAVTDCSGSSVTAVSGGDSISLSGFGFLLAGQTCTVVVDVLGAGTGLQINVSSDLSSSPGGASVSSGFATDQITVTSSAMPFTKSFTDDPTLPGGTVNLEFTILNANRSFAASNISFTDDLDATLPGLVATGLPASDVCGTGSILSGTSVLTLSGGNLPAEASCTFSVTLQVPAAAAAGAYPNTTSSLTADIGGSPFVGPPATESLFVNEAPSLTKTFLDNPVGTGATTTVEFTITNNSTTSPATDINFLDNLSAFLSGVAVTSLPAPGFCGAGSNLFTTTIGGDLHLSMNGGNLAAGASCTFTVDLQIPPGALDGDFINTTEPIQGTVDGTVQTGSRASDTLTVLPAPALTKTFTDDPVVPGGTVTLEFTISLDDAAPADATAITFTDDLNAALTGLAATGLPMNDICGVGSSLTGTSSLSFTGGTLAPGASCTFSVTLQVPAAAAPGSYTNTTSSIMAMVSGETVTGNPTADDLEVSGLEITKSFTDDPVIAGDQVTLEFTITNSGAEVATGLFFTDNLSDTLPGLVASTLPMTPCGPMSSIVGTNFLIFTGGEVAPGSSCTFSLTLDVPAGAVDDTYLNSTSSLSGTVGMNTVTVPPATDILTVSSSVLALSKTFTDDPVAPGEMVTLEFTVTNTDPTETATAISFTDDLDAALTGLVATGLPATDVCGVGSSLTGTSVLTLSGGTLAGGASCTFSVVLTVPGSTSGTVATNTTSTVTGTINGLPVDGSPASDDLVIQTLAFSKVFDGPTVAGGTPTLTFTIENVSASPISNLAFTDDLDAVLTGLVATGLPMMDVCGTGSQISGTSFLTFTGGSLLPNGSCSIVLTLQVPGGAAAGTYPNTSSDLFQGGLSVAEPATADLTVAPPPTFTKVFAPDTIPQGGMSTLTFTIDNTASSVAASSLNFADPLPAGVLVAAIPSASTTCVGGTLTASAGTGAIAYSGGTIAAASSCTVTVDVTGIVAGAQVNTTSDLTSSSGNSGPATDTLTVTPAPPPTFAKVFAPDSIGEGQGSTLTFTIDNTAALVAATALDFTDNLPAGVEVAAAPNASTTCTGGTLTATAGAGVITYTGGTVAAASSCTVTVDVVGNAPGTLVNTTGDLTSSLGNSGTATDTLVVNPVPGFAKVFAPNPIAIGGTSTLTFTIDNTGSTAAAPALDFTDNLPAAVTVASPANAAMTCTGGTLTAVAGSGTVTYTGGTAPAVANCTVSVDVTSTTPGSHVNTTGDLTSSLGNSGTATDTLTVNPPPGFAKVFAPDLISVGGISTLTFTIDNTGSTAAATALDFTDNLPASVTVATPAGASTTCTGGTLTAAPGSGTITYTGGTVAAGGSCTVSVDVTGATAGSQVNTTGDLTSSLSNSGTATDTLTVEAVQLTFTKEFIVNPVLPGGSVDLEYTITNSSSNLMVTDISFTDDMDAVIPGLVATGFSPLAGGDPCGAGSTFSGTSVLTLSGGNLAPNGSCTFRATLQVPGDAADGSYSSTSSAVSGMATGAVVSGSPASADLVIEYLSITKFFSDMSVTAGSFIDLTFTITNPDSVNGATDITFSDDLEAVLSGMEAVGLPQLDVCGPGSQLDGTSTILLTGGSLAPAGSCTFTVTVQIPADASSGTVMNVTSGLDSTVGGTSVAGDPAAAAIADLIVVATTVAIPTMSTWGMVFLILLLSAVAVRRLRFQ